MWEVARAYPGRALTGAFFMALAGLIASIFLVGGLNWVAGKVIGVAINSAHWKLFLILVFILWPFVSVGLWWNDMYGQIRGWWIIDTGD